MKLPDLYTSEPFAHVQLETSCRILQILVRSRSRTRCEVRPLNGCARSLAGACGSPSWVVYSWLLCPLQHPKRVATKKGATLRRCARTFHRFGVFHRPSAVDPRRTGHPEGDCAAPGSFSGAAGLCRRKSPRVGRALGPKDA